MNTTFCVKLTLFASVLFLWGDQFLYNILHRYCNLCDLCEVTSRVDISRPNEETVLDAFQCLMSSIN
jgi:hypothetical protein